MLMKKSLIALAIAGAMTAPIVAQADATLYGAVETRLIFAEDQDANLKVDKAEMGVKGSSELENLDGVKATYQIEFRLDANGSDIDAATSSNVNNDVTLRKANVGLVGDFGIVQIGRQNNLGAAVKKADIFMGDATGFISGDRFGNSIYYVTPKMSGFEAYAGLIMDGGNSDVEEDLDAWQVGFNYALMGLDLSAAYTEIDGNYDDGLGDSGASDVEIWGVGASYSIADFTVAGTYENAEQGSSEDEIGALTVAYAMGNTTLKAGYSETFPDGGGNDFEAYNLQAEYALGKKAKLKAAYNVKDEKSGDETDQVILSYAVAF
jgi:predicted porin